MKKISLFFRAACTRFTVLLFLLYALFLLLLDPQASSQVMDFLRLAELFVLACVLQCIEMIFELPAKNDFIKIILHFCAVLLSFSLVFLLARGSFSNPSVAFLLLFSLTVFYCLIDDALYFIGRKRQRKNEKENYTSIF